MGYIAIGKFVSTAYLPQLDVTIKEKRVNVSIIQKKLLSLQQSLEKQGGSLQKI